MADEAMKPKVLVLAGNYAEFCEYAQDDKRFIFGDSRRSMAGISVGEIVTIGTFYRRKDSRELEEYAQTRVRPA